MRSPLVTSVLVCASLLGAAWLPVDLRGQAAPRKSEIRGTVVMAADRTPIKGAELSLEGRDMAVQSDAKGRFKFPKVAAGTYVIRAEVAGYPAATSTLVVADGDRLEVEFQVGPNDAVTLPELAVTADVPRLSPVAEFNRRATSGHGRYLTREDIEKRGAATMMDLLRNTPGVRVSCPRGERICTLAFARSAGCSPAYFLDGIPADKALLYSIFPGDVEGVELYAGPSETPPELNRSGGCGVVAIWSRVGRR